MNNKIEKIKRTSAIFLAIVLVAGTIATILPSFMTIGAVQAEPHYRMDDKYTDYKQDYGMDSYDKKLYGDSYGQDYKSDYKKDYSYGNDRDYDKSKKDRKSTSIKKLDCNNINVNVNGLELDVFPPFLGEDLAAEAQEGTTGPSSLGGNRADGGSEINDFRFICINNNNNNNIVSGEGEPIPPRQTGNLNVDKLVLCEDERNGDSTLSVQQAAVLDCNRILEIITEDQFNIQVTGNDPQPSSFAGSDPGTIVRLGAGNYQVTETPDASVATEVADLQTDVTEIIGPIPSLFGDCTQIGDSFSATGTIAAGESGICHIRNEFVLQDREQQDSPIITQEIQDSTELTALEKITKLKQQWMELTP